MNAHTLAYGKATAAAPGGALISVVPALGRAMISAIFLLSGAAKLAASGTTIAFIRASGVPLAEVAYGLSTGLEVLGGLALLLGLRTRWIAAIFFLYALATAILFHANLDDQNQFLNFFKNIAMAGGLLHVVALGGGRLSLDARQA
ncbi:DoxX family protein [Novosphingobium sp.]|uniref:DoxX family protein n=1 Tax=Novosphingobium sp. TaxID=1874826 RepID=UPI0031DF5B9E